MTTLQDLMISRVRVRLIELFFHHPEEMYYVREITRMTREEINAVRRELDRMLTFGLLRSEQRGNRVYYFLNPRYPFYQELRQMVAKSSGIGAKIRQLRKKLGDLEFVMFSSRFVAKKPLPQGEVDMLVVGNVVLPELEAVVKEYEKDFGREISYSVLSSEEFKFRKQRRDPFIMDVLYLGRVMVIGSEEDFVERKTV